MPPDNDQKPQLLVVDDSRLMRVAARKILKSDFDIIEAGDGEDAWERIQENPGIVLVMSDLSMPNLDGLGLLRRIREAADSRLRSLPVVIVTGAEDDDGSKQAALAAGASDFITKPFDSVQLLARTKAQARQRDTEKALQETAQIRHELERSSAADPLTGLANEQALIQRGGENLSYAVRHDDELALLTLRIDRFKIFFLRHGKAAAENVLCQLASLLTEGRRREDTVARTSLADFALLLPSANPQGARRVAEQLRERIASQGFTVDGKSVQLTVSIGLSCPTVVRDTRFDAMREEALQHLTKAEKAGGNRVEGGAGAVPETVAAQPAGATVASPAQVEEALRALARGDTPSTDRAALLQAIEPLLAYCQRGQSSQQETTSATSPTEPAI
ncbi:MAG TPA: diguanylate cyclase [Gammaproteobacteria bacterium]|nr:diguanylate cyclase [Gammaproteobacteria bacterium]